MAPQFAEFEFLVHFFTYILKFCIIILGKRVIKKASSLLLHSIRLKAN